jgi:hypothetical protein
VRSCGFFSDTGAREIEGVGAVRFIVSSNGDIGLAFLEAKDLDTLNVGTTSIKFLSARHVEKNLLQDIEVTSTLSASKLEFFLLWPSPPNATLKKLIVCHYLEECSNIVIHSGHIQSPPLLPDA